MVLVPYTFTSQRQKKPKRKHLPQTFGPDGWPNHGSYFEKAYHGALCRTEKIITRLPSNIHVLASLFTVRTLSLINGKVYKPNGKPRLRRLEKNKSTIGETKSQICALIMPTILGRQCILEIKTVDGSHKSFDLRYRHRINPLHKFSMVIK